MSPQQLSSTGEWDMDIPSSHSLIIVKKDIL